jgi:hypothetical protein
MSSELRMYIKLTTKIKNYLKKSLFFLKEAVEKKEKLLPKLAAQRPLA